MIYYYIKFNENEIGLGCNNMKEIPIIENAKCSEITKEIYDALIANKTSNHRIYIDDDNQLQLRDKFTKWDESTESWIPDDDAIANDKKQQFKSQAQQSLNDTNHYESESYKAICTDEENAANLAYRIELRKIMKDMYDGTELPQNPNKKE